MRPPKTEYYYGLRHLARFLTKYLGHGFSMVEIGSYAGESTAVFAECAAVVYAVDPWLNDYDENDPASQKNMGEVERVFDGILKTHKNVHKMKMTSVEASKYFQDGSLDFVYIDGMHTYEAVKEDILTWLPKVKKGGFIGGHDYYVRWCPSHCRGIKQAVDELVGKPDVRFIDSSWLKYQGHASYFQRMRCVIFLYFWECSRLPYRAKRFLRRQYKRLPGIVRGKRSRREMR